MVTGSHGRDVGAGIGHDPRPLMTERAGQEGGHATVRAPTGRCGIRR
jgi:hypothetical protein